MNKLKKHLNNLLGANTIKLQVLNKGKKNITYFCTTDKGEYVIKFLTPQFLFKKVNIDDFENIYNVVKNANNSKFIVPLTNAKISNVNKWKFKYFSIFPFIENDNPNCLNNKQIEEMSKTMNQFHNITSNLQCSLNCNFNKYVLKLFKNKNYKNMLQKYYEDYNNITAELNSCLIHGDFAINNILFKGNEVVGLIDFDYLSVGSREEELIRACRNFENKLDKQTFVSSYLKNCSVELNITREIVKKFIIKDFINEICVYYFQTKTKNLKTDFKELLNQSIKELVNVDGLINEIWEVIKSENFIC